MKENLMLVCGLLGLVGFIVSCLCVAMIAGFTRSTHTVQYLPHDNADIFKPEANILEENEKALLNKVGPKRKKEEPTIIDPLDSALDEITNTELKF